MDGLIYPNPYYSHVPSLKQHGRLDPFLFSGTIFSAGGYSAQYGQALSSVLILNSKGMADSTFTGGGLHTFGGNVFHTHRWKNFSWYTNFSFYNLAPYHEVSPQITDWTKSPRNKDLKMVFRINAGKNALIKIYSDVSGTSMGINLNRDSDNRMNFNIRNTCYLLNTNYTKYFNDNRSSLVAGVGISSNEDKIREAGIPMRKSDLTGQARVVFKRSLSREINMLAGAEYYHLVLSGKTGPTASEVSAPVFSLFAESEATLHQKLAIRLGLRSEYSEYGRTMNLAPRTSMAWKFTRNSQMSFSYGMFHQLPDPLAMLYHPKGLTPERAVHYIANYQFQHNDRILRTEIYYKQYSGLVTEYSPGINLPGYSGYARGFEVFLRDKKTIPNLDTWISYTFTDSRRKTLVPDQMVTPEYISRHTASLVAKYWFGPLGMYLSGTYHYATPRNFTYLNAAGEPVSLPVPAWSSVDISISKPLQVFRKPALFFFSLQNVTGFYKLQGYVMTPAFDDPMRIYRSEKRSFFFGIFISMYND
jgi:hypothetical protein